MSGLRDKLLRLRSSQAAQEERQAGLVSQTGLEADANTELAQAAGALIDNAAQSDADASASSAANKEDTLTPEWDELGVRVVQSTEGSFLVRESRYPLTHRHGYHELSELTDVLPGLDTFRKPETADTGYANLLFLDLETTGLGVGAGNVPFMVGLAYLQDDVFVVEQMLIRHPAEERAMIGYLCQLLPTFTHLVTYNGRTFDWPVLYNRFILHGFRTFQWEPIHIDLLHPSRSVWRNTLVSCKLSHVEEERLGIKRKDDVPGSLAPAIYFQYLADSKPGPLLGVFQHNEIDMLSLAALSIRFGHFLGGNLGTALLPMPQEAEELLRTGLWLEKMGKTELAEPLFALVADHPRLNRNCLCLLAERDKKCGNWQRAVILWQKAVEEAAAHAALSDYEAHIELAMYYEHKTKQLDEALVLAETAFEMAQRRLTGLRLQAKRRAELELLRKRIDRLQKKLIKYSS
ncbi:ribonuclease H-like domain-containing protein [Paenibacillus silvisoli]|uniref:ribonuclease H-like domain-containing protein n=1 Tax=Paenibacillus silvisoli TaxID=3110539 RepID=UPI002805DD73|nr:ribonuclease H-like domain-containing protein [Paenibacillus silvisoli]